MKTLWTLLFAATLATSALEAGFFDDLSDKVGSIVEEGKKSVSDMTDSVTNSPEKATSGSGNGSCSDVAGKITLCNHTGKSIQVKFKENGDNFSIDANSKHSRKYVSGKTYTAEVNYWGKPNKIIAVLHVTAGKGYVVKEGIKSGYTKAKDTKTTIFKNKTSKSVSMYNIDHGADYSIGPKETLTQRNFKPGVNVKIWFFGHADNIIGTVPMYHGAVYEIYNDHVKTINPGKKPKKSAKQKAMPNFNNPPEAIKDMDRLNKICIEKKLDYCKVRCSYLLKQMKSQYERLPDDNDPGYYKQRWSECYDETKK